MCVRDTVYSTRKTYDFANIYDHQGQGLYISYDKLIDIFDNICIAWDNIRLLQIGQLSITVIRCKTSTTK